MYFGIDIGGTNIKYGIIDENLNVVEKNKLPTKTSSEKDLLDQLYEISTEMAEKYDFEYIGIGAPGYVDNTAGTISGSSNTPFKNTNVRDYLEEKTGKKILIGNDANCAAYGEFVTSDKSVSNSIMLTLGTGVGGGIILDKRLYTGSEYKGGELGHMVIICGGKKCGCGKRGCLEQYASATALVEMTKEKISDGCGIMSEEMRDKLFEVDGNTVFEYYRKNCPDAIHVLNKYTEYLVCGIENYIDIFDPDEIILAGGITNEDDILINLIKNKFSGRCDLKISSLKNDAGFYGAAMLGYTKA